MAVNPLPPAVLVEMGVAGAADYDEACNAADGAGQGHGADNYLLHIDSGVPGRISLSPTTASHIPACCTSGR